LQLPREIHFSLSVRITIDNGKDDKLILHNDKKLISTSNFNIHSQISTSCTTRDATAVNETEESKIILQDYEKNDERNNESNNTLGNLKRMMSKLIEISIYF
jgi:hypothetical protein